MTALSTTQAAAILGVTTRMVRFYIQNGIQTMDGTLKLKARLITARSYVLQKKDVEKFKQIAAYYSVHLKKLV